MNKKYASGDPEAYFLFLNNRKYHPDQLIPTIALLGRERDHGTIFRKLKVSADDRKIGLQFALLQLIHLIGYDHEGTT